MFDFFAEYRTERIKVRRNSSYIVVLKPGNLIIKHNLKNR